VDQVNQDATLTTPSLDLSHSESSFQAANSGQQRNRILPPTAPGQIVSLTTANCFFSTTPLPKMRERVQPAHWYSSKHLLSENLPLERRVSLFHDEWVLSGLVQNARLEEWAFVCTVC
jgi:hypothetical protein